MLQLTGSRRFVSKFLCEILLDLLYLLDSVMHEVGYFLTDNCPWSYITGRDFRRWNGQPECTVTVIT
jgi:hypothetical protein